MKKLFKVMFVAVLAIAMAAPAFAEIKVNGYYRTQFQATNQDDTSTVFDGPDQVEEQSAAGIDARLRWKITNQINDNVKVVWFLENDAEFGVRDGGPGGDSIATETKNLYLAFNVPNTPLSVQTGLQGINPGYEGIVLADDWSAIKVNGQFSDMFGLTVFMAKPAEGGDQASDDTDLYGVEANFKFGNGAKLSLDVLNLNKNSGNIAGAGDNTQLLGLAAPVDAWIYGAEASGIKAGPVTLGGFLVLADAEDDPKTQEYSGFAGSIQAKMDAFSGRLIYISGDDGVTPADSDAFIANLGGNYDFAKENLAIFLTDAYYNNLTGGRLAMDAAVNNGLGLLGLTAQYNANFGAVYLKSGLGYFQTNEDNAAGDADLGIEVGARVGTKIAEKVDTSLNLHYAMLGDYYKIGGQSPDDIWKVNFMFNVGF